MNDIIWEPPPQAALDAQVVHRSQYGELALALRQRKGEWAKVNRVYSTADSAKNTAQNMRRGVVKGFVKGEYEVLAHDRQIWVRYTGPADSASAPQTRAKPASPSAPQTQSPAPTPKQALDRAPVEDPHDDGSADDGDPRSFPARVRAWAKLHGHENVGERGRLPQALVEAYEADTLDYRPSPLQVVR